MNCVAIIPARGGSKGIKLKNLRKVAGERLIVRAVKAALGSELVSRVYVSTDCPEIAHVARRAGAEIILRPDALAEDECSSESAILHVLSTLENAEGLPDWVVFLQCTSPFTTSDDVTRVIRPLEEGHADSAFLAVSSHGFIWRSQPDGGVAGVNHDPAGTRQRRQDREPEFRETGAVYGFPAKDFMTRQNRFIGKVMAVESGSVPFDIDDPEDLVEAGAGGGTRREFRSPLGIKALITDFDGVHTDAKVMVSEQGQESVRCNRRDGMGVEIARKKGLRVLILSKERNPVVEMRARKLQVECIQGCDDKLTILSGWLKANNLHWDEIAYVGDDLNDIDCLQVAGFSICPADAVVQVRESVDHCLRTPGGGGCIREIVDLLIPG
jgi:YrbI family 3-deoxy-D-manno-octulosonate 8-phosphate phosphatase